MSKILNGILLAGGVFAVYKLATSGILDSNLSDKFKFVPGSIIPNGYSNGNINILISGSQIFNQTPINVTISKLFNSVKYLNPSTNQYEDIIYQPLPSPDFTVKANQSIVVPDIIMQMPVGLSTIGLVKNMISGSVSTKVQIVTRFAIAGINMPDIISYIDFRTIVQNILSIIPTFGLFGYKSKSLGLIASHRRNIKSGKEYDILMPKQKGTTTTISSDADVYDTLDLMQKIVGVTYQQTEKLAKQLQLEAGTKSGEAFLKRIYQFLYENIQYKEDENGFEDLREPAASWAQRKSGIDCDCYSIFISAVLTNAGIPHYFRIIRLTERNGKHKDYFQHVYVVVPKSANSTMKLGSNDYWVIDPVLDTWNKEADMIVETHDKAVTINGLEKGLGATVSDYISAARSCAATAGAVAADMASGGVTLTAAVEQAAVAASCGMSLNKINPFGPPDISIKPDTLFEEDHKNSNNLFERVWYNLEPYNLPSYALTANQRISNAYAFDHFLPDIKAALQRVGAKDQSYTTYTYNCTSLYNFVGSNYAGFLAQLDQIYAGPDGRANAYKNLLDIGFDNFLLQFGIYTPTTAAKAAQDKGVPQTLIELPQVDSGSFDWAGQNIYNGKRVPGLHLTSGQLTLIPGDKVIVSSNNPAYNGTRTVLLSSADDGTYPKSVFLIDVKWAGPAKGTFVKTNKSSISTTSKILIGGGILGILGTVALVAKVVIPALMGGDDLYVSKSKKNKQK